MDNKAYNFGMIGLGTMGCNLVLNMCDNGFTVAGYDKNEAKTAHLKAVGNEKMVAVFNDMEAFINSLQVPKVIMLLVPAGAIVDVVIAEILPYIKPEDIIVDCGNSHFTDTNKRIANLNTSGIHFMGLGVSGGEKGARFGPSIMPGGNLVAYQKIAPMLNAIAAKVNGNPCTAYMGQGAAGHYVKMVHNGIEYAIMQMIAEAYHILKFCLKQDNNSIQQLFEQWNKGRLQSFLIEITAAILLQKDDEGEGMLIDVIKDTAKQKGTGAWMSQDAMTIGAAIPAIDAAVTARILSSIKKERVANAITYSTLLENPVKLDVEETILLLEDAMYAATIIVFSQGLSMLQMASNTYQYQINLATVAEVWQGGCIIRAALLTDINKAYKAEPLLTNMLQSNTFIPTIKATVPALRTLVTTAIQHNIPVPALSGCLQYFDAFKSAWLPANLIQAQRDFFGAHTYERLDKEGVFHTQWNSKVQ